MKLWICSGRPSDGAALLAKEEGFGRLRTRQYLKINDIIVNWGQTNNEPILYKTKFRPLNLPDKVVGAVNKLLTFKTLELNNVTCVPWTQSKGMAAIWLEQGKTVIARKTLTGHEGAGIIIIEPGNELIEAPLYTLYIKSAREFRVHATPYGVIDTQWKVRDPKREVVDWKVRSYKNGFIFQRKNIEPNDKRDLLAVKAIQALGLDFGGLDIVEDKKGDFYVLEVNTAPGIEGTTVQLYAKALKELAERVVNPNHKPGPGPIGQGVLNAGGKPGDVPIATGVGAGLPAELGWKFPVISVAGQAAGIIVAKPIINLNLGWID